MNRFALAVGLLIGVVASFGGEFLGVFQKVETAGISGFRVSQPKHKTPMWDRPQPGHLTFDAAHRRVLVRFPGMAERAAEQLRKGYRIRRAELILPFDKAELWPSVGYNNRMSFGVDALYRKVQPQWHAVAWALRRPWTADADVGPTFNAYINGGGYWQKYGAGDGKADRHPRRFGPTEISHKQAEGRMDITALLSDRAYGGTLGQRLRALSDCGLILRKWETYDFRFRKAGDGAYEWGVSCGGRGIVIKSPRLVLTLVRDPKAKAALHLPPAADVHAMAKMLQEKPQGRATVTMPDAEQLRKILKTHALRKRPWMSDWQWKRIEELAALGGGYVIPKTPDGYARWVDGMLADPPRYWNGWDVPDRLLSYFLYRDALPSYVREYYFHTYWTAWLMPDRATAELEHPQALELWHGGKNKYYEKTGDWRGNCSFYRDGYCYAMSTMNFNHTAAMGALLGGHIIGSKRAIADGRHGLEHWPLRTWCWYDGSTQESIDHYYYSLTLSAQKMFADFGPTHLDRMMGRSILAKSIDELTGAYHPALRHFLASSTRTGVPNYVIATQDGLQHIVHTLSRSGALHDIGNKAVPGQMRVIGNDCPPGRIAQLAVNGPWAPEFVSYMVDEKPIPYEMTNTYKQWGGHAAHPLWRRTYLGRHYGLASTDLYPCCIPILGHWRRKPAQVRNVQELGTMLVRYGMNDTAFVNAGSGWLFPYGVESALHHTNTMIVVTKPNDLSGRKEPIRSLQASIALYNYEQPAPTWRVIVGGRRVVTLPVTAKAGEWIAIHDGVSYLGILPLPAMDLGRDAEVRLEPGVEQTTYDKSKSLPALVIHNFNYRSTTPLAADWKKITRAYGGFVIEFGDVTEHGSFDAFRRHLSRGRLRTRWDEKSSTYHVRWENKGNTLEVGCKTTYRGGATPQFFAYRRVNGKWPYLADGLDRDTTLTQQGRTGRLEKNGAVLTCEKGRMAYLQTEPVTGTYVGWNPLPDPTFWSLAVPGGIRVQADGKLSIARIALRPKENRLWVDSARRKDQTQAYMASALLVSGLRRRPVVERNGKRLRRRLATTVLNGAKVWVIPLTDKRVDPKAAARRCKRAAQAWNASGKVAPQFIRDWYIAGPFPNPKGEGGFDVTYGPSRGRSSGRTRSRAWAARRWGGSGPSLRAGRP